MGGAGMLSVSIILPFIGKLYDHQTQTYLPTGSPSLTDLKKAPEGTADALLLHGAQLHAGSATLQWVAILPCFLILVFGAMYFFREKRLDVRD